LTEQGAVVDCAHHGYRRDLADPAGCNRVSDEAWPNPFFGATQGISASDYPSGGFPEKQPVFR
jgi:hypothetical protein